MFQNHYPNCYQNPKIQANPIHFHFYLFPLLTTIQTISTFFYALISNVLFRQTGSSCMMFTSIVNTIPTVVAHHSFYNKQNISGCAENILVTVTLSAKHQ